MAVATHPNGDEREPRGERYRETAAELERVRYELAKSIAETHEGTCECEHCQLAFPDDFQSCDLCDRTRHWELLTGNSEARACRGGCNV